MLNMHHVIYLHKVFPFSVRKNGELGNKLLGKIIFILEFKF